MIQVATAEPTDSTPSASSSPLPTMLTIGPHSQAKLLVAKP